MSPKKITVVDASYGESKAMLSNDEEFRTWIHGRGVRCLFDHEGYEISGFESLVDEGKYTLGPPPQQPPQQQDDEGGLTERVKEVDTSCCKLGDQFLRNSGLQDYAEAAKRCNSEDDVQKMISSLEDLYKDGNDNAAAPFACIVAPSGTGKTQLAATAAMRETTRYLYTQPNDSTDTMQKFYQPHIALCSVLFDALQDFQSRVRTKEYYWIPGGDKFGANDIYHGFIKATASCQLFVLLNRVLFDHYDESTTFGKLRKRVENQEQNLLVFLDEVPEHSSKSFRDVIVLRDVLRAIGIRPILMSTHSGAHNAIPRGQSSRDGEDIPWCKVFTMLPQFHGEEDVFTQNPWIKPTERPLVSSLMVRESEKEKLAVIVGRMQKELQTGKVQAWTGDSIFQLCQLFRTAKAEKSDHAATHMLVGKHFGTLELQGEETQFADLTRSKAGKWRCPVRMVVPDREPILFLALTSWKMSYLENQSDLYFPLVNSRGAAISVRQAYLNGSKDFKRAVYTANPDAHKLDGDDLEVLSLASITLASLQFEDEHILSGVMLPQFLASVYHFMLPGRLDAHQLETTKKAVEDILGSSVKNIQAMKVPACTSTDSPFDEAWAKKDDGRFCLGNLKRPRDSPMRDGSVDGVDTKPVLHIECKNLKQGLTKDVMESVVKRIRYAYRVVLLFTSEITNFCKESGSWETAMAEDVGMSSDECCFLVMGKDGIDWLKVGSGTTSLEPTLKTEHLVVIIATGEVSP